MNVSAGRAWFARLLCDSLPRSRGRRVERRTKAVPWRHDSEEPPSDSVVPDRYCWIPTSALEPGVVIARPIQGGHGNQLTLRIAVGSSVDIEHHRATAEQGRRMRRCASGRGARRSGAGGRRRPSRAALRRNISAGAGRRLPSPARCAACLQAVHMLTVNALPVAVASIARRLPPFPKVVLQLLEMLGHDDVSMDALTRQARNDPVIASGILATANRLRRINAQPDLHDPFVAASLIGIAQVRRIVVTASINIHGRRQGRELSLQPFQGRRHQWPRSWRNCAGCRSKRPMSLEFCTMWDSCVSTSWTRNGFGGLPGIDSRRPPHRTRNRRLRREAESGSAPRWPRTGSLPRNSCCRFAIIEDAVVTSRLPAVMNVAERTWRARSTFPHHRKIG